MATLITWLIMAITAYAPIYNAGTLELQGSEMWRGGPYEYNGAIYQLGLLTPLPGGSRTIRIVKSTNGITWTSLDTANEMASTTISGGHGIDCVRVGDILHVLGLDDSTVTLELTSFNLASPGWTPVIGGGPVPSVIGSSRANPNIFQVSANGTRKVIAYNVDNGGIPTDIALVVHSGAWGAPVQVSTDSRQIRSIAIDASDRVHLVTFTTANRYEEYIFDASNVLTGPFVMYGPTVNSVGDTGPAVYNAGTDTITVPILEATGGVIQASILLGTPSVAPAWMQQIAGNSGVIKDWIHVFYVDSPSPYLVMIEDGIGADQPLVYLKRTSGAWGPRTVIFNPTTDTGVPTLDPASQADFRPLAALLSNGVLAAVEGYQPTGGSANVLYYIGPYSPPILIHNPGPGTKKKPDPKPNPHDFCLHREYRLYCSINVKMITCGSIPACFSVDERDWATGE